MFEVLLLLLIAFSFNDSRFLFFWFHMRNFNIIAKGWQHFRVGKLNMASLKNRTMTEKSCTFHFESYNKRKLRGFTESSFKTSIWITFLLYQEIDRVALYTYHLVLFLPVLVFETSEIFSISFFFFIHPIFIYIQVSFFDKTIFH